MSEDNLPANTNIFSQMEKMDELQISNPKLRDKLAYKIRDKTELSYAGVKQLILQMSQAGQALEIVKSEVVRVDPKEGDKETPPMWYAEVILRNKKTGHEAWGVSENTVYDNNKYDPFGRTKAVSKAIRNAERQQLPELLITEFLEKIGDVQTEKISEQTHILERKNKGKICDCEEPFFGVSSNICVKCGGGKPSTE